MINTVDILKGLLGVLVDAATPIIDRLQDEMKDDFP
jgi:hypothetical protein